MTEAVLADEVAKLKEVYHEFAVASGCEGQKLIRIPEVELPKGCSPPNTQLLLVVQSGQPRPQIFVKPGIKVPGGREPRSTSVVQMEGEAWLQFSYSFTWDENTHSLVQFVGAALQRFAKTE